MRSVLRHPVAGDSSVQQAAKRAVAEFRDQCLDLVLEVSEAVGRRHHSVAYFLREGLSELSELESQVRVASVGQAEQIRRIGETLLRITRNRETPEERAEGILSLLDQFVFRVRRLGLAKSDPIHLNVEHGFKPTLHGARAAAKELALAV